MAEHDEIPLPASPFEPYPFRAVRDVDSVRFEAIGEPPPAESRLRYGILILIAAGLLVFYLAIAISLALQGRGPGWWFHALVATFAVLISGTVVRDLRLRDYLLESEISRRADGALELWYRWRNGAPQVYCLTEPARIIVLFRQDLDATRSWRKVSEDQSAPREEKFRDEIMIELYLVGNAMNPRIPILRQRWRPLIPCMTRYFQEHATDLNRAEAVEAAQPLARALHEVLRLPVEFRVAGGPLLERLETPSGSWNS
ncbi:MAG: hypothetical protein KF886_12960 [Candidatus Hydrogenedentes bacterium]|nr:hypothetical protein [Candidatus Hydrogenedentota bacterium]